MVKVFIYSLFGFKFMNFISIIIYACSVFQNGWGNDVITRMTSGDLAKSVPEAENMCELHKERKVRITCFNNKNNIKTHS